MPRLDAYGILQVAPVGEGDEAASQVEAEWVGPGAPLDNESLSQGEPATQYDSVRLGNEVVSVGDYVYLTPEAIQEPCEIGRVVRMYERNASREKMVWVQWYWRPEHVKLPSGLPRPGKREIFRSQTFDENPIEALECKCVVNQLRKDEKPSPALSASPHHFYFTKEYDPKQQTFSLASGSEPVSADGTNGDASAGAGDRKRKQPPGGGGGGGGGEKPAKAARLPKHAEETLESHTRLLDEALGRIVRRRIPRAAHPAPDSHRSPLQRPAASFAAHFPRTFTAARSRRKRSREWSMRCSRSSQPCARFGTAGWRKT